VGGWLLVHFVVFSLALNIFHRTTQVRSRRRLRVLAAADW